MLGSRGLASPGSRPRCASSARPVSGVSSDPGAPRAALPRAVVHLRRTACRALPAPRATGRARGVRRRLGAPGGGPGRGRPGRCGGSPGVDEGPGPWVDRIRGLHVDPPSSAPHVTSHLRAWHGSRPEGPRLQGRPGGWRVDPGVDGRDRMAGVVSLDGDRGAAVRGPHRS